MKGRGIRAAGGQFERLEPVADRGRVERHKADRVRRWLITPPVRHLGEGLPVVGMGRIGCRHDHAVTVDAAAALGRPGTSALQQRRPGCRDTARTSSTSKVSHQLSP